MQRERLARWLDDAGTDLAARPHPDPAALRAVVARLAAVRPTSCTVSESSHTSADGLWYRQLVLRHDFRAGIRATLVGPEAGETLPAVLVSQGRNATLARVSGAEPPDYPDRDVARQLAQAGFVTLTLDYGVDGSFPSDGRDDAAILGRGFELTGRTLLSVLVEDALAALPWLAAQPEVDADRIGLFGHSLGAAVALHTGLLAPRRLPVCTASHLGTYPELYGRRRSGDEGGALFGVLRHADLPDLYGALVPAPLQIQYGRDDDYLDPADAARAGARVRAGYAAAGHADLAEVLDLPMGHGTGVTEATAFFVKSFTDEPAEAVPVPPTRVHFDLAARTEALDRIDAALASGALMLGRNGREVEELVRRRVGRPAVAVSSGSSALEAAYRAIGVAGRTVLTPVNTFFATAAAAEHAGARVGFVDMEPDGLGLDPESLRQALNAHRDVAAVAVVHIGGVISPALPDVLALCAEHGVPVVEDAAHALGSTLADQPAGSFGRLGTFSFCATKVATSGEGGAVTGVQAADLDEIRRLRDHGKHSTQANLHSSLGSNWRLSELHAATGIAHLERLDAMVGERRELAAWYDEHLGQVPGLRAFEVPADAVSNYYKYLAFLPAGVDRPALKQRLRQHHGVALAGEVYDTLLCDQPYFADRRVEVPVDNARSFADRHVCLPIFPGMTRRQQRAVLTALSVELV